MIEHCIEPDGSRFRFATYVTVDGQRKLASHLEGISYETALRHKRIVEQRRRGA